MAACVGNKTEQAAATKDYSELLGMWVLQQQQDSAKLEMMFNEDSTGFVFVADTFHCGIKWQPDSSLIDVRYLYSTNGIKFAIEKRYSPTLDADTLFLQEVAPDGVLLVKNKFVRFKQ